MDSVKTIKELLNQGGFLTVEHARTDAGEAIVVAAEDFLFPQHDDAVNRLKHRNKAWLRAKAKKLMNQHAQTAAAEVRYRWKGIIDGTFFE